MISDRLFDRVLVEPVRQGADRLFVVSGYATATMASQHLNHVKDTERRISVALILGMTPTSGLNRRDHLAFQGLTQGHELGEFRCSYLMADKKPVHSKVYIWTHGERPLAAYTGSANYTQNAFWGRQREVLTECDPEEALAYYRSLGTDTIFCDHGEVEQYVTIGDVRRQRVEGEGGDVEDVGEVQTEGLEHVTCSLLTRGGQIHTKAGLNWGQRDHREPNQAYIPVTAEVDRSGFFPPVKTHFTVLTDDGKVLICTRAQDGGKAIQTPAGNSQLGEYFRNRLGLPNGAFVRKEDLERYGRTTVDFYRIDDDTYQMDFAPPRP